MGFSSFLGRYINKRKVIYHVGAWSGNFGDSILQQSIRQNLMQASKHKLEFRYINCQHQEFTQELIEEINQKSDLLLIGGGGLVFYRPQDNSKSGWQWNIELDLIKTIKVPFVLYGVGYNQFTYDKTDFLPVTNKHIQETVNRAALFSVRNNGTRSELMSRGADGSKIEVIPDSGMFLPGNHIDVPYLDKSKHKIGFNWTTDRENQTFPEPFPESRDKFIKTCIDLLNYAIEKHSAQVVYIGHMSAEFDREIIAKLKEGLVNPPLVTDEVLAEIYPPSGENASYLVDIYNQMDVVLGMRGHANIVSFGQNTPFIGLGSHRKVRYFLDDIGRSKYFFDARPEGSFYSLENMKQCFDEIILNLADQKQQMANELVRQRKISDDFNKKILTLL